jgi:hypothetical protein
MKYFGSLKNQLLFSTLLLSSLFLTSCDPFTGDPPPPFNCALKPYTVGAFATGALETGDCFAINSTTTLIDYYEFKLDEVETVVVSLDKGTPRLYSSDGTFLGDCCGGSIEKNLTAGTYVVGVANNGSLPDYRMAVTTTKVGFGGCPTLTKVELAKFATGNLDASDCFARGDRNTYIDYYEFNIDVVENIVISLDKGNPRLYTRDGDFLGDCCNGTIEKNLTAGTYVLGVANNGSVTDYRTAVTSTKAGFGGCPTVTAYTLGTSVSGDLKAADCFARSNRNTLIDYYEFMLGVTSDVTITVDNGTPNLYTRDGNFLGNCCNGSITKNLTTGTYVIGVANNGTLNYTLSSSTP